MAKIGLTIEPWGVPTMLLLYILNSKYPAFRLFHINLVNFLSLILSSINFNNREWDIVSKIFAKSPSITHWEGWKS